MRVVGCVLVAGLFVGCAKPREPAPEDMESLCRYVFEHWEDEKSLEDAIGNLGPWLDENVDSEDAEDGWELTGLTSEDVTVDHPDRSLEGLLGAASAARSKHSALEHAAHVPLEDQLWSNPVNYKVYVRSVDEGAEAFVEGEGMVRTTNEIETKSFGVSIPYTLYKDYRWVEGTDSFVARSWIEERACGATGANCLELSFSVDLFYGLDQGDGSIRFTATWSETTTSLPIGDDLLIAGLAGGLQTVFSSTEEFLDEGGASD
jgi:hypothetical protein